jgi:peptidoglycan/xylan/chitin deacetylase (PgdA/CDA1 family)
MRSRVRLLAAVLALLPATVACVPTPAGRTADPGGNGPSASAAVVSPVPSPTGPTPSPSFSRPTPTPLPTFLVYTVREGDTLTAIARRFETTALSLAIWNRDRYANLDPESSDFRPDRIQVGWQLVLIPNTEADPESLLESPAPSATEGGVEPAFRVIEHGRRGSNQVALTFDMGGRLDPALDIVAWLADHEVPATIFPTGRTATTTPEGLAVLEAIGEQRDLFDLGNHSWSHPDFRELDDPAIRDQLERTEAAMLATVNLSTKPWFRPPYGGIDDQIPVSAAAAGWPDTVLWDIDTIDWKPRDDGGPTADEIVDRVLSSAQGGSIVLMHLGGYETLAALPGIVAGLEDLGLEPVTLDTMFGV